MLTLLGRDALCINGEFILRRHLDEAGSADGVAHSAPRVFSAPERHDAAVLLRRFRHYRYPLYGNGVRPTAFEQLAFRLHVVSGVRD